MYFEITPALRPGQQLTVAQRTSSLFAEEPRIGAHVLRRASPPLKLAEKEFAASFLTIKRHFMAGSIEVAAVNGEDKADLRKAFESVRKEQDPESPKLSDSQLLDKLLGGALSFAKDELQRLADDKPPALDSDETPPTGETALLTETLPSDKPPEGSPPPEDPPGPLEGVELPKHEDEQAPTQILVETAHGDVLPDEGAATVAPEATEPPLEQPLETTETPSEHPHHGKKHRGRGK